MPEKSKSEGKTSSLRSIRVKPDRSREAKPAQKPSRDLPHTITSNTSSLPDKITANQPVTSAIAPVADKPMPEKSASPLEGKENIPIMNADKDIGQTKTTVDDDVIEVPYKPPTPEIIDLDADGESDVNNDTYEVKKRKLDILKQGGLEVTAVSSELLKEIKDIRPSVIQTSLPFKHDINLSITVASDSRKMPPPQTQTNKKPYTISAVPTLNKRLPKELLNGLGLSPPKVMQSKSIFNYSERVVYGNPKDITFVPPHVTTPKVQKIADVLDLTVKSPQKPIVEIVRVPNVSSMTSRLTNTQINHHQHKNITKNPSIANLPQIEGRLGSNLEITLVSSNKVNNQQNKHQLQQNVRAPHKRTSNGTLKHTYKSELNIPRKTPHHNLTNTNELSNNQQKSMQYLPNNHQFPAYMNQIAQKSMPFNPSQNYLPFIDPIYYSAFCSQSLGYPTSPLAAVPPMFPQAATVDQLQFFKEFMAQSARGRYPFVPQEGNMSITSNDNPNVKK